MGNFANLHRLTCEAGFYIQPDPSLPVPTFSVFLFALE